ncbi:MAG: hypothetical protein HY005_03285 [Candidatus Staskawiczbacteria bacterium]|nr:hypothetical protein [Candidatus Staskawiczbacteria bacterium]
MSSLKNLRGGLEVQPTNPTEKSALDLAILTMAARAKNTKKKLSLPGLSAGKAKEGRMSISDLVSHANGLATAFDDFISNTALPFIWEFGRDPILRGKCSQYESDINDLLQFCPENDPGGIFQEELAFEGMEALCFRIRHRAELSVLVFDINHAVNKEELESLLGEVCYAELSDGSDEDGNRKTNMVKAFKGNTSKKAKIWAFGKGYDLAFNAFGYFRDFAEEKLALAIRDRSVELATAHRAGLEQRKQEVFTEDRNRISPDELLFGDSKEVNGKNALFTWDFQGKENAITLQRDGDRLYIIGQGLGNMPMATIKKMREKYGPKPFVSLDDILDRDGKHLCSETWVNNRPKYMLGRFIDEPAKHQMTCWARTAAGNCCDPSRLLAENRAAVNGSIDKNAKKRLVKPPGEFMTDREFFYSRMLGSYNLTFPAGFNHKVQDDNGPTGEVIILKDEMELQIQRDEANGKDFISVSTTDSPELASLLEKAGLEIYDERDGIFMFNARFEDGLRWKNLPIPLANGLKLAFVRLKASE